MPIRKPDKVIEERRTLGSYERQLEQDRLTVMGMQAGATAIAGVASGLGIFGAAGIAALLWGKDLEKLFEQMVGVWPESGAFFSPEWIAKWGDNPIEQTEEDQNETDNDGVNELDPVNTSQGERTFEGMSPYDVYTIVAAGRQARYDHMKNNIVADYRAAHPLDVYGPHDSDEKIISDWYANNPSPPPFLLNGQVALQTNIRVTCARRNSTYLRYFQNTNPPNHPDFVKDNLLDWVAYNTGNFGFGNTNSIFETTPKRPYNYLKYVARGVQEIAAYAWWSAPTTAP